MKRSKKVDRIIWEHRFLTLNNRENIFYQWQNLFTVFLAIIWLSLFFSWKVKRRWLCIWDLKSINAKSFVWTRVVRVLNHRVKNILNQWALYACFMKIKLDLPAWKEFCKGKSGSRRRVGDFLESWQQRFMYASNNSVWLRGSTTKGKSDLAPIIIAYWVTDTS